MAPITIRAKFIQSRIRSLNLDWDDSLPNDITEEWEALKLEFNQLPRIALNRHTPTNKTTSLHAFSDASQKGYGFAIYQRTETDNRVETALIFAKARITKPKQLTIPRLELLAASLAARALQFVSKKLMLPNENRMTVWCDSKCTLSRIYSTKILATFEDHRVREIRQIPNIECRYVPSLLNPADHASRGLTLVDFLSSNWLHGPDFLRLSPDRWPKFHVAEVSLIDPNLEEETEPQSIAVLPVQQHNDKKYWKVLIKKFSSLHQLLAVVGNILHYLNTLYFRATRKSMSYTQNGKLAMALHFLLRWIQNEHFSQVYTDLENHKDNELVRKMRIFKDEKGLLRCQGRFRFAPAEKSPILLPPSTREPFVRLLILHLHELNFHAGTLYTLAALRRQYWVQSGRRSVYISLHSCTKCKRFIATPYKQPENSDLPSVRLTTGNPPFTYVGLDTLGPLSIDGRNMHVLLITCLITRAMNLEPVTSLETKELHFALRRFRARHTTPIFYYSDNAPQFNEIEKILHDTVLEPFQWKRIPPKGSWMAGVYERLVAPVKQALFRTFHGCPLSPEQFRTILFEIEASLNNRPITYVGEDDDIQPLTPNDFLQVKLKPEKEDLTAITTDTTTRKTLVALSKQATSYLNSFWKMWSSMYLNDLRQRHINDTTHFKKRTCSFSPEVHSIVLVEDVLRKRNQWHLGRITELIRSQDGEIRSAPLKLASGHTIIRPVQSLYPLECPSPPDHPIESSADTEPDETSETISIQLDFDF
jgi:hypothetical protein